jgi:predicted nucleotidyltransferase
MDYMNKEQVIAILTENINKIRAFHVRSLYLFGSVVRGEATATSDVDILVEFEPHAHVGLFEFARLQRMLSGMLGCRVDISTAEALHPALKDRILKEAIHAA